MKEKAEQLIVKKENIEQIEREISMYKIAEKEKEYSFANKKKKGLLGKAFICREKTRNLRNRCADLYCLPVRTKSRNNHSMECLCFYSDICFKEISTDRTETIFSCLSYEFLTFDTIPVSSTFKDFKMYGKVFEEISVEEYWNKAFETMRSLREKILEGSADVCKKSDYE